jgi:hypothetical protein
MLLVAGRDRQKRSRKRKFEERAKDFQFQRLDEVYDAEGCLPDRYEVLEGWVRKGVYGTVFKVADKSGDTQQKVVKLIPLGIDFLHPSSGDTVFYSREEFEDEVKVTRLMGENAIGPKVFYAAVCTGQVSTEGEEEEDVDIGLIVMEYVGITLFEYRLRNPSEVVQKNIIKIARAKRDLRQKAAALGYYHLDTHEGNWAVQLDDDGNIVDMRLIDFGRVGSTPIRSDDDDDDETDDETDDDDELEALLERGETKHHPIVISQELDLDLAVYGANGSSNGTRRRRRARTTTTTAKTAPPPAYWTEFSQAALAYRRRTPNIAKMRTMIQNNTVVLERDIDWAMPLMEELGRRLITVSGRKKYGEAWSFLVERIKSIRLDVFLLSKKRTLLEYLLSHYNELSGLLRTMIANVLGVAHEVEEKYGVFGDLHLNATSRALMKRHPRTWKYPIETAEDSLILKAHLTELDTLIVPNPEFRPSKQSEFPPHPIIEQRLKVENIESKLRDLGRQRKRGRILRETQEAETDALDELQKMVSKELGDLRRNAWQTDRMHDDLGEVVTLDSKQVNAWKRMALAIGGAWLGGGVVVKRSDVDKTLGYIRPPVGNVGLGLFVQTAKVFERGEVVTWYEGEIITANESVKRDEEGTSVRLMALSDEWHADATYFMGGSHGSHKAVPTYYPGAMNEDLEYHGGAGFVNDPTFGLDDQRSVEAARGFINAEFVVKGATNWEGFVDLGDPLRMVVVLVATKRLLPGDEILVEYGVTRGR